MSEEKEQAPPLLQRGMPSGGHKAYSLRSLVSHAYFRYSSQPFRFGEVYVKMAHPWNFA